MATKSAVAAVLALIEHTLTDAQQTKGTVRRIPFTFEKLAGNTDGDWLALAVVHKEWIVSSIQIQNDALTGCTDCDIGLYKYKKTYTAPADLEVADVNAYYDALSLASAAGLTQVAFQASAGRDKANVLKRVWEDAGATSLGDAEDYYVIALTFVTGGTATGTISGMIDVITPT